ncbi:hypothetical protein WMY93_028609 [Mugilogobius chulae]|uniref:Ashwin n=1 Tax=Mugilogobius chulae TaxID=88201 RepID=A0AAW0MQQ8_9GOBI
MLGNSNMATSTGLDGKANSSLDVDLLLHPELLSEEFLKLILNERKVNTRSTLSRDDLTELYLRHVMPLPQRTLPSSRWGRTAAKTRDTHQAPAAAVRSDRKRPLIVFDGSSSNSGPPKVRRSEGSSQSSGNTDRLKPPPGANMTSPIRKLTTVTSPSATEKTDLAQEAHHSSSESPLVKKKIQHVTWP